MKSLERSSFLCLLIVCVWLGDRSGLCRAAMVQDNLLQNGSFTEWDGGVPKKWTVATGAQNGSGGTESVVREGDGPALELVGNAQTKSWRLVKQAIAVSPGDSLRLTFSARAVDVRREGNQYDNCYVGVILGNGNGQRLGQQIANVASGQLHSNSLVFRVPEGAASADVMIFLSKSGTLQVRECSLERLRPEQSFKILVDEIGRHYSFLALKKIDWPAMVKKYQPAAEAARTPKALADVIADLLAEFEDVHAFVMDGNRQISKYRSAYDPNFDFKVVDRAIQKPIEIRNFGVVGRTDGGIGYIRITTLSNVDQDRLGQMVMEIRKLWDAPGIIVDLRQNPGGSEQVAAAIAGMFVDKVRDYARQQIRSGPDPENLVETEPRRLAPVGGVPYTGPIVCLVGPGTVSSAEGMALMFKSMPQCTLVGQPTRGASGNPAPVPLPNGLDVYFSRWISLELDGTPIEGRGVTPQIKVEHKSGQDTAFEKAIELLASISR